MITRTCVRRLVPAALASLGWLLGPGAGRTLAYVDVGPGGGFISSNAARVLALAILVIVLAIIFPHARRLWSWILDKVALVLDKVRSERRTRAGTRP